MEIQLTRELCKLNIRVQRSTCATTNSRKTHSPMRWMKRWEKISGCWTDKISKIARCSFSENERGEWLTSSTIKGVASCLELARVTLLRITWIQGVEYLMCYLTEGPDAYISIYEQRRNFVRARRPKPVVVYQFFPPLTIERLRDILT